MEINDYKQKIPIFCLHQNMESHMEMMLCWSISNGRIDKYNDQEGPFVCQNCPDSIKSKRLDDMWWKNFRKLTEQLKEKRKNVVIFNN